LIPTDTPDSGSPTPLSRSRTVLAPALAGVTVISALANLFTSLPHVIRRGGEVPGWLPLEITHGSRILSAAAGIFLLVLARALARRKHAAWQLAIVMFAVSTAVHPFKGKMEYVALLSGSMVFVLLAARREFWVKSDPVTQAGGFAVMAVSVLLAYAYTAAGYFLLRKHFALVTDGADAMLAALGLLTSFQTGAAFPLNREASAFAVSACLLEAIGLFTGLFLILAPFIERRIHAPERDLVDPLLHRFGRSSVSYFALEGDNRYYFPRTVPGVIPYTYRSGVALVAGEPLCDESDLVAACAEFAAFCEEHDWQPAFYQWEPGPRDRLEAAGFSSLKIGEECWYDLTSYSLKGALRARLRHGVRRAEREGITVAEHRPGAPGSQARQEKMEALSAEWLSAHGGREMGYLLGGLSFRQPRDRRYFVAERAGEVVGLVTFVPVYARRGMVLDMMRRAGGAPPGTMEALVHHSLVTLQSGGFERASLSLAPLAPGPALPPDAPAAQRILAAAFERLNRLYNFKTLYTFKHRLGPDFWEARYLVYRGTQALPAVAFALLRVHEPRSFLARLFRPSLSRKLEAGEVSAGEESA
jgi:phosphatidylglycerol lysyltransferase